MTIDAAAADGRASHDEPAATAVFNSLGIERAAFLLCILAGLVPIWSVAWFPTVDGPMHAYIVFVLDQLAQPGTNVFDRIFERNSNIEPNLGVYFILWPLSKLVPMLTAEKLFVSGYWLLFASSALYLMRSFGARSGVLALLMLPLALGYFLHWGFYNFVLSQALFLLAAGYALRHLEQLRWRHVAVLALLMLVLAVTHLVGIAMFLLFIGLARAGIAAREALTTTAGPRWSPALARLATDAGRLLLAALPALFIIGSFLVRRVISDEGAAPVSGLVRKIAYVASIAPVYALDKREVFALAAFTLVLWALALKLMVDLWRDRALRIAALPVVLPPAVLGGLVIVGTLGFAGFDALPRLLPFLFFMLLTAFGVMRLGLIWRGAIMVAVVGGLVGTSIIHFAFYRQMNELYAAYASGRTPPPLGSAIVAFDTSRPQRDIGGHPTGWRMNVSDHFRELYAREHGLAMLNVVHLEPQVYGYFPVAYRRGAKVAAAYRAADFRPPAAPLRQFELVTGVPVREVSFWPGLDAEPEVEWILADREPILRRELAQRWRLLPRTSPLAPYVYVQSGAATPAK